MNRDTFSSFHPIINFVFFMGAIFLGMFIIHPAFLICSGIHSCLYYITVKKRKAFGFLGGLAFLFVGLSVFNPLFNTYGETVLFTYFSGRRYTLEALFYGMALAGMMVSILLWFANYNAAMTSDKFQYIFGRLAPSVSLILTMVLRLVPNYEKKIRQISQAQKGIGQWADTGSRREKARHGLSIVSALTSWALEGGIIMADSMRCRGYGCEKRSSFSIYRFEGRDKLLLGIMTGLLAAVIFCVVKGGTQAQYTPQILIAGVENSYTVVGVFAWFLFLSIPAAVNIREEIIWHILKSEI